MCDGGQCAIVGEQCAIVGEQCAIVNKGGRTDGADTGSR